MAGEPPSSRVSREARALRARPACRRTVRRRSDAGRRPGRARWRCPGRKQSRTAPSRAEQAVGGERLPSIGTEKTSSDLRNATFWLAASMRKSPGPKVEEELASRIGSEAGEVDLYAVPGTRKLSTLPCAGSSSLRRTAAVLPSEGAA